MKKETAVEWLIEQYKLYVPAVHQKGLATVFEEALEKEEKQCKYFYDMGSLRTMDAVFGAKSQTFEEFYQQHFQKPK